MSVEDESIKRDPHDEDHFSVDVLGNPSGPFWAEYRVLRAAMRRHGDGPINWHQLARALADEVEERRLVAGTTLNHYKDQVAAVAMEYAIKYEWCDEVQTALAELGIELEEPTVEAEVRVTYKVVGKVGFNHLPSIVKDGNGFLLRHLHVPSLVVEPVDESQNTLSIPGGFTDPAEVEIVTYGIRNSVKH